jgi:two-component system NtrC family response regulator
MVDGGSLLLDEIGEMPLELQVRILRLIQEREIEKIGAASSTKVDVRIIAATHRDLAAMVAEGTFREDLYYRLLVVPVIIPPLRERPEDIPELVLHFLERFRLKHSRPDLTLPAGLLPYFSNYNWPGNVRQLENVLERIVLLSPVSEITSEELPDFLFSQNPLREIAPIELPEEGISLEGLEQELILRVLKKFNGNQTRAAQFLGLTRRTLAYRLEKIGSGSEIPKGLKQIVG